MDFKQIKISELKKEDVPGKDALWGRKLAFIYSFYDESGYSHNKNSNFKKRLESFNKKQSEKRTKEITIDEIRSALLFYSRATHHKGAEVDDEFINECFELLRAKIKKGIPKTKKKYGIIGTIRVVGDDPIYKFESDIAHLIRKKNGRLVVTLKHHGKNITYPFNHCIKSIVKITESKERDLSQEDKRIEKILRSEYKRKIFEGEIENALDRMSEYNREEYLRKADIIFDMTPSELELRELIIFTYLKSGIYGTYYDPENCPTEVRNSILEGVSLMKEITSRANLNTLKRLLTPMEYERFIPIYDVFKRTGGFMADMPGERQ